MRRQEIPYPRYKIFMATDVNVTIREKGELRAHATARSHRFFSECLKLDYYQIFKS